MSKKAQVGKIMFSIGVIVLIIGVIGSRMFGFGISTGRVIAGIGVILALAGGVIDRFMG